MGKKEKSKSLPILCDKYGKWKDKLEKYLQTDERIARMAVPKMVKNGNNSLFGIRNRFCSPFGVHAIKTDPNFQRRIKTIFHQFRNTHARSL